MSNTKPKYYMSSTSDVIDLCHEFNLSFDIGNVWKYTLRAGKKDPSKEIEDLEKAKEYLDRRIKFIKDSKCDGCKRVENARNHNIDLGECVYTCNCNVG